MKLLFDVIKTYALNRAFIHARYISFFIDNNTMSFSTCSRPHIKKSGEKSLYRIIWEWFHRCYGIIVILVGLTQVSLGVFLIVPPRPVWIIWILMLFAWVISFTVLEVIRCVRVVCFADPDSPSDIEMKNRSERKLSSFNN